LIRLLLDLNVLLDVILDRGADAEIASQLWAAIEEGQAEGLIPAHGVSTIYYLLAKSKGAGFARQGLDRLLSAFAVAGVDLAVVRRALALAWPDFEDAVCAAAAEAASCDAIVTRNLKHYPSSPVAVLDPAGALSWVRNTRRKRGRSNL
jgi:predicted nucleic acid-binding protein